VSLSGAQTFLTIDATNDRLIRVDQNTGSVANVGPLGIDVSAGIPVRFNGDLVVLSVGGAAGFAVIDEATGALPSLTPFSMPGSTIQTVEGIASDLSGLLISLDIDPTNSTFSNTIARLDPSTGSLTEVITIPLDVLPNGVDIDGMAYDPVFGDLLAVDAAGDIEATVFFRVSIPNGLVTPLFELPFDGLGGAVISPFIEGDSLWVTAVAPGQMPLTPSRLIRFDRGRRPQGTSAAVLFATARRDRHLLAEHNLIGYRDRICAND